MGVKYPTSNDVEIAFAAAFPAGQPFDRERWEKLEHDVLIPDWQAAGHGIETLEVAGARLFRVRWEFTIDRTNTSSEAALRISAAALKRDLAALCDGEDVKWRVSGPFWIIFQHIGPKIITSGFLLSPSGRL